MGENRRKIYILISISVLFFLALPAVSAYIEISDMGHYYDGETRYGYVDYTNTAKHNVSGALLVFIDDDIVAGKILNMPIRYVAGFRCSPIKTLEFLSQNDKGGHAIVAYAVSMNCTIQRICEYTMEGWEEMEAEEGTGIKEED